MGTTRKRFDEELLGQFASAKILGVRAGREHDYTGVWVVVVERRVFVRSWHDRPTGWFRAFRREPLGQVVLGRVELDVRAAHVRGARILEAVTDAYGIKYPTKASRKWVVGFAEASRLATTLELMPL